MLDVVYRKLKERNGGAGEPEYRLRTYLVHLDLQL